MSRESKRRKRRRYRENRRKRETVAARGATLFNKRAKFDWVFRG